MMKIAVLTSGGDSAGMNAAVRSIVKFGILRYASSAPHHKYTLTPVPYIAEDVILGLYERDMKALSAETRQSHIIETPIPPISPVRSRKPR